MCEDVYLLLSRFTDLAMDTIGWIFQNYEYGTALKILIFSSSQIYWYFCKEYINELGLLAALIN